MLWCGYHIVMCGKLVAIVTPRMLTQDDITILRHKKSPQV